MADSAIRPTSVASKSMFDGVIDFDKLVADPANPQNLREEYHSDWLHPNATGYEAMGKFAAARVCELTKEKIQSYSGVRRP